jgi:hypothetical protein
MLFSQIFHPGIFQDITLTRFPAGCVWKIESKGPAQPLLLDLSFHFSCSSFVEAAFLTSGMDANATAIVTADTITCPIQSLSSRLASICL